jgi:hypothetical protein
MHFFPFLAEFMEEEMDIKEEWTLISSKEAVT